MLAASWAFPAMPISRAANTSRVWRHDAGRCAGHIEPEHLPVFDCANPCGQNLVNALSCPSESHIRMMAAAQPFISRRDLKNHKHAQRRIGGRLQGPPICFRGKLGFESQCALSRRIEAQPAALQSLILAGDDDDEDVEDRIDDIVRSAHDGAPSRDGCRDGLSNAIVEPRSQTAERLPDRRKGYTQKAIVGGHKVYLRTGEYDDGVAGRGFHRHAQGRRRLPVHDEQLRHRRIAGPSVRRAAGGVCGGLHLHTVRAGRASCKATMRSRNATSILDYVFRELAVSYLGRHDLAHVPPGAEDDQLGGGADEDRPTQRPVEMPIEQVASTGYMRQASAGRLIRLASATQPADAVATAAAGEALAEFVEDVAEAAPTTLELHETTVHAKTAAGKTTIDVAETDVTMPMSNEAQRIMEARIKGYEGDPCTTCGHMTLVRNGTCLKCDTCGTTTGCS